MVQAIEHPDPPAAPRPERPRRGGLWREWRAATALLRLVRAVPELRRLPRGEGATVVLIPGWRGPEATMEPLRRYLGWLGHDARHWGLGVNRGDPEGDSRRMARTVAGLARRSGRAVSLVGWSLGGVVARETARLEPRSVARVVTLGTPVVGGPTYTLAAGAWGAPECERIAGLVRELDERSPIVVPIAAVFSRRDEVVSWPSCIDRSSAEVRHFEVQTTHLGLIVDPAVWRVVAGQLATGAALRRREGNPR